MNWSDTNCVEYKDTGSRWLQAVPSHWQVLKAKYIFREISEKGRPEEQLLSATQKSGLVPRDQMETRVVMPVGQLETFKFVRTGNFVISLRSFQGGIEYSEHQGLVSPAYTVLQLRTDANARYFKHLLKSQRFVGELDSCTTGIRQGKNVSFFELSSSLIPLPPLDEQEKIGHFLDAKTSDIDQAIQKKLQLIELLIEQKTNLVNHAVTKGTNPDAAMKDSGVDWIGKIPAHWKVKRAKYLFAEIDDRSQTGDEELLSVSHTTGVTPRSEKNIMMFMAEDYTGSKLCKPGDVVFNIMWAWMGALGVSNYSGIVSPSYGVYRPKSETLFNSWYLEQLLRSWGYVQEYNRRSTGLHSSRLRLYSKMFFMMEIGFPTIAEQNEIEKKVQEQVGLFDATILATQSEIKALNEFKETLIANAVTGKIKI